MPVTWIEASAGTGKTYTLIETVVSMLVNQSLPVERVLLVTFTEKATAELKTRIRDRLRERARTEPSPRLDQALEDLAAMTITTIHGFCRTVLTQFPLESGLSFQPELVDQGHAWRSALREALRPRLADLPADLLAWADWTSDEAFLEGAQNALHDRALARPAARPHGRDREQFDQLRRQLHSQELHDLFEELRGLDLPDDPEDLAGPAIQAQFKSGRLAKPYQTLRSLAPGGHAEQRRLIREETIDALRRWNPDLWDNRRSMWNTQRPQTPAAIARVQSLAARLAAFAEPWAGLAPLLEGVSRWSLLQIVADDVRRPDDRELTFSAMIERVRDLVVERDSRLVQAVRERWTAALIDEFQDTDDDQWTIFSNLFLTPAHHLVIVGDPKQSIYRFRGADLSVYRQARAECLAAGADLLVLDRNYRSTPAMIEALNHRFASPGGQVWTDFAPVLPGDKDRATLRRLGRSLDPLEEYRAESEDDWNRFVVAKILELVDGQTLFDDDNGTVVQPGHIFVLVRQKRQAWALHRLLSSKGIPATVAGAGGLLGTREAAEILIFLKALESPRDPGKVKALRWTRLFAGAPHDPLMAALDEAQEDRRRGAFVRAFRRVLAALEPGVTDGGGLESVLEHDDGDRIVTNAEHVLELVQDRVHRGDASRFAVAAALERWKSSGIDEDEVDLRQSTDAPTLKLMTIHAAKGLEAPIVFHAFPTKRTPRRSLWLVGKTVDFVVDDEAWAKELEQQQAEELRLRYVAETRAAAHQVIVTDRPEAPEIPRLTSQEWAELPPWRQPAKAIADAVRLLPPVPGLEQRRPFIESHSGLWKRAHHFETPLVAEWDRPRVQRDDEREDPVAWSDLPAGPVFGDLIHNVLEMADWTAWAPTSDPMLRGAAKSLIEDACVRERLALGGRDWTSPVDAWLESVLNTPLQGPFEPLVLSRIPAHQTRRELEFHVPLAHARGNAISVAWDRSLLTIRPGFLMGRIDALIRWDEKLWIVDWKTNRLGPLDDPAAVMKEAGYDLQAQWYWEALRRLAAGESRSEVPLGGVVYVFLRGPQGTPVTVVRDAQQLDDELRLRRVMETQP